MRYGITNLLLCITLTGNVLPQAEQTEPQRYAYRVTGKVAFSKSQSLTGATVYVMPATRPINGRIPFTHADEDGRFSIEFTDIADDYRVCAHPGETGGLLPLVPTMGEAEKTPAKLTCTKSFRLSAEETERRVLIRLR